MNASADPHISSTLPSETHRPSLIRRLAGASFTSEFIAAMIIFVIFAFVTLFPFYWALRTSFSTMKGLLADPTNVLPPDFSLTAFKAALGMKIDSTVGVRVAPFNFWNYLGNTVFVSSAIALGSVLFSSMAAFAFTRLRWPGREWVFGLFLSSMMVPAIVLLIPNFVLINDLGWMNTYQAMIVPYVFGGAYGIFFLRQFFLGINRELEEAAYLDGASYWEVFFRHIIPMSQGPMFTIGIITFITAWNDYLWPFLVGRDEKVRVLTVAVSVFKSQTPSGTPDWPGLMVGTTLTALPVFVLFLVLGRRISSSIQFTGIK